MILVCGIHEGYIKVQGDVLVNAWRTELEFFIEASVGWQWENAQWRGFRVPDRKMCQHYVVPRCPSTKKKQVRFNQPPSASKFLDAGSQ